MISTANKSRHHPAVVMKRQDIHAYTENIEEDCFILLPAKPNALDPKLLAELINQVIKLANELTEARQAGKLKALVELLAPDIQTSEGLVLEALMIAHARQQVLNNAHWLTAEQVSTLAGFSSNKPSAQPNKWKLKGTIFAIHSRGADYFPEYALDPNAGYRPVKALADILAVFKDRKDGWGLAYWFAGANGFLGGHRPQDLLVSNPNAVLDAAKDEVAGITHG